MEGSGRGIYRLKKALRVARRARCEPTILLLLIHGRNFGDSEDVLDGELVHRLSIIEHHAVEVALLIGVVYAFDDYG